MPEFETKIYCQSIKTVTLVEGVINQRTLHAHWSAPPYPAAC